MTLIPMRASTTVKSADMRCNCYDEGTHLAVPGALPTKFFRGLTNVAWFTIASIPAACLDFRVAGMFGKLRSRDT